MIDFSVLFLREIIKNFLGDKMKKKLYRSAKDKMLGGVAGGIAEYFDIDSTLIRVLFILIVFLGGSGILAYIILWIIVPEKPFTIQDFNISSEDQSEKKSSDDQSEEMKMQTISPADKRSLWGGVILIGLGVLFLMDNYIPRFNFSDYWPLILIGVGVGLLLNAKKRNLNF